MDITQEVKAQILKQPLFKGTVVTGSMIPVIKVGEAIKVEVKAKNLKRFDIIVFVQDQKLICHFLWQMNSKVLPRLYQTRNMFGGRDFPISEEDYIGKVISHKMKWYHIIKVLFL